jgi:peptidyl-prolyl cis-trans isomerase B (cyclophilin B)
MLKRCILIVTISACFACSKKEEKVVITKDNVREALTAYGEKNPEDEVVIETSFGTMRLRLYKDTPLHRANFIKLIKDGHYENATFYRVVNEFAIQGGDLDKKLDYTIPAEFNQKYFHKKGALAMARFDENNPHMESSSSEFYIIHGGRYADWEIDEEAESYGLKLTPEQRATYLKVGGDMSLDQKYTVFGEVIDGIDVIDKIASVKVYNTDTPLKKIPLHISIVEPTK